MNRRPSNRPIRLLALFSMLGMAMVGCNRPQSTAVWTPGSGPTSGSYWPTEGWRTSTPEEQGMDSQKLALMLKAVKRQKLDLHSLLVIRHGYIVSETYYKSYNKNTKHTLYSCTKSFVSTLVGIAIDQGYIDSIELPVLGFFPDLTIQNRDERKEAMTIADLLTMRSGLDWPEGDPVYQEMYRSRDWANFVLDKPMAEQPGSQFVYCSGCSHVLSTIVQQGTGQDALDFAEKTLLAPLGITGVDWEMDAEGIPIGGWGLQLTPRDMAKLGYLYLHDGLWDGQQIVSVEWVRAATQKYTETDSTIGLGYGYQWWTYPSYGAYAALGRDGQTIFVAPDLDLVVVTTAQVNGHDALFALIEEYVVPAVKTS
jgi:CubicO group peptidase (beta-lactamase class C family)